MTYVSEGAAIRAWFTAEWESGVPIHLLENSEFTDKPENAPWARLAIRPNDVNAVAVGGPVTRYRYDGDIILEIFTPSGTGDGRAKELADLGDTILRGRAEDGIQVWAARAITLGVRDGWYRINVIARYQRDEDHDSTSG